MIKPDATLLIQIQLAIIGIVVVAGLFYLWRVIVRLEQRINNVSCKCPSPSMQMPQPFMMGGLGQAPNFAEENSQDELAAAQELMQQVFGGMDQTGVMMFSMQQPPQFMNEDQSSCVVEEIVENPIEDKKDDSVEAQILKEEDDDNESVSTDTNPFSKSKLTQMKVEKLRALCAERSLSSEGQKPQLIDRLLGVTRE